MKCPYCQTVCPDGTSFCPKCDAVLDEDLIAMGQNAPDDDAPDDAIIPTNSLATTGRPHKKRPAGSHPHHRDRGEEGARPKKRRRPPVDADAEDSEPSPPPAAKQSSSSAGDGHGKYVSKYAQYWEDEPPAKKAEAPIMKTADGREYRYGESAPVAEFDSGNLNGLPNDPLEMMRELWRQFMKLPLFQRVSAGAAVALLLCCIVPWYSYQDPDSGLDVGGYGLPNLLVFVLGCLAIGAITLLTSKDILPQIPRAKLSLVPVGAGLGAVVLVVLDAIYLIASNDYRASIPTLLVSALFAGGTFLGGGLSLFGRKND